MHLFIQFDTRFFGGRVAGEVALGIETILEITNKHSQYNFLFDHGRQQRGFFPWILKFDIFLLIV